MEDDLAKVFDDYLIVREVFEAVSTKYDIKTATHIKVLVQQYNSYMMKKSDNIVNHINKMLVMAKDLAIIENIIYESMQISIILNSFHLFWNMVATVLEVNFINLFPDQLPLILKTQ